MSNPTITASGKAERGLSTPSTSWSFTVTLPAGTNRLVVFVAGANGYSALGTNPLLTLRLGTTDLAAVTNGRSGTGGAVCVGAFYIDDPVSVGSTTVTVTNASNDNGGGWAWLAIQDCDLAQAPAGYNSYASNNTTCAVTVTSATGDLILIDSASYGGTTGTAGANTTVLQASIQNAQGGATRSALGYSTGPNTPSITGWNLDQCCTVAVVNKGVAAADTTPPTQTGSITVGTVTSSSIQITWPAGSDNVAVTSYETSPDGSTWTDRGNVLTYTFTGLSASTSYTLRVRAKDAAGNVSTPALSVTQSTSGTGPTINTQPSNQTVTAPATATFTVSATASAGSLTYQWQRQPSGGGGYVNVSSGSGGTTASYTTGATTVTGGSHNNGDTYRCNVTDSNGTTASAAATLTVNAALAGLTSSPLKDNTGTLHLSAPFEAFVLNASTGALVLRKTGLTSHASTGVVTFSDAALTAATQYRVVWRQTTTGAQGVELLTAA